jgi:hypothetical protein
MIIAKNSSQALRRGEKTHEDIFVVISAITHGCGSTRSPSGTI